MILSQMQLSAPGPTSASLVIVITWSNLHVLTLGVDGDLVPGWVQDGYMMVQDGYMTFTDW